MPASALVRYGKWLAAVVVAALVVLAALLLALERVPADLYRDQLVAQVEDATGRDFRIEGEIRLALFPYVGFRIGELHLANPEGAESPDLFAARQVNVRVAVLPLLLGNVRVVHFQLEEPVVNLEVDEQGRPSWEFGTAGAEPPVAEAPPEPAAEEPFQIPDIEIGEVRLGRGRVTFFDARSGTRHEVLGLELTTRIEGLEEPFSAELTVVWNDEPIRIALQTSPLGSLNRGEPIDASVEVDSRPVRLGFDGKARLDGGAGRLALDVPSVRRLASWVGTQLEARGDAFGPLALKADLDAGPESVSIADGRLDLDEIGVDFAVDAMLAGKVPAITARLEAGRVDVDAYLPPAAEDATAGAAGPEGAASTDVPPPAWSREPIDYSGLRAVDLDLTLRAGPVVASGVTLDRAALHAVLKGGRLDFEIEEIALYDGSLGGRLVADGSADVLVVSPQLALRNVSLGPLLNDAADLARMRGQLAFSTELGTRGRSVYDLVRRLGGQGEFSVRDGELVDSQLLGALTSVASPFDSLSALLDSANAANADFERIGGTFQIRRGVLSNRDLRMIGPGLELKGAGTSDLAERKLDYAVDARVGKRIGTGVVLRGPWHDVGVEIAARDALEDAAKDAAKDVISDALRPGDKKGNVKDELKKAKKGLLGGLFGDR